MRVVSVNVGLPRTVVYQGKEVRTGIFKEPVDVPVALGPAGFEGDGQADLKHHGGPDQGAYAHPMENYPRWQAELGVDHLPLGALGENLTLEGLPDDRVHVGDVLAMGEARLVVTMPREPCFKLGLRLGSATFVKAFLASCRVGYYLRVLSPGRIAADDAVTRLEEGRGKVSVEEVCRLRFFPAEEPFDLQRERLERVLAIPELAAEWRRAFEKRLQPSPASSRR